MNESSKAIIPKIIGKHFSSRLKMNRNPIQRAPSNPNTLFNNRELPAPATHDNHITPLTCTQL